MQVEQRPNFLERMAVKGLLLLENHLEKKSSPPVDWAGRRQLLKELGTTTLVIGSFSAAGLTLRTVWEWHQAQEIAQKKADQENYYGTSWQNSPDMQMAIKKAGEDPNLRILRLDGLGVRLYGQDNIFFYQTSNLAVLAVDKKSLDSFLDKKGKAKDMVAFTIDDQANPAQEISGVTNFKLSIQLDNKPADIVFNASPEQNIAIKLSANVAAVYESYQRFGLNRTIQIINAPFSPDWQQYQDNIKQYLNRFAQGQLPPFIKAIAINPIWLK